MRHIRQRIEYILVVVLLLTAGCASKYAYHTIDPTPKNCVDPTHEQCTRSYYQEHPSFDLAFAEYTERGNAFDSSWTNNVLERIQARANDQGVVVVTFIHGWKHNARETDSNLLDFKKSLETIAGNSSSLYGRRLIGVYIGWRGVSLDIPGIKNLTFWDRKSVAEEVGVGGVTKLLLELDQIDKTSTHNVLVIVGHSFGGAIVISATAEVLAEGIVNRSDNGDLGTPIGDAVIVLNAAIEANQSLNLIEAAIRDDYPNSQNPFFISISTDADWATHYTFPIGQTLGSLITWHQHDLKRPFYRDRLSDEHLVLKEEHLDATTAGNYAPFLTHRLVAESTDENPKLSIQSCKQVPDQCVPKGLTTLSGHPTIGPLPDNYPFYFIKTDKTVMKGHNDIFNSVIHAFMMSIIDDTVRRAYILEKGKTAPAPILSNPQELNQSFRKYYSTGNVR